MASLVVSGQVQDPCQPWCYAFAMAEQRCDAPRPGRTIDVECHDLDRNGHGLARWNGWVIVVPDLLPGETAQVQLQQRQRSRWLSRRVQLQTASNHRRHPP